MPEDYLNNSQSNVNAVVPDSTISSQNQNQNPTQNGFNNPRNQGEENIGITPFFIFQFLKELIKYFINLPKKFVNAFTDAEKKGKAWREQREAKKAERAKRKEAKRTSNGQEDGQEDIISPSPQSPESPKFSMFRGEPTATTPGRTEEEAMEQAAKDRQAGQRRQGKTGSTGPTRKINKPSGK